MEVTPDGDTKGTAERMTMNKGALAILVHGGTESKFPGAGIGGFILFTGMAAVTLQLQLGAIARPATQSPATKEQIVEMAMNASGIRDTARVLRISPTTVIKELKKYSFR